LLGGGGYTRNFFGGGLHQEFVFLVGYTGIFSGGFTPGIFFFWGGGVTPGIFSGGGGATNVVAEKGQREWGSGGGSPLVRGSTQFANE
jgi:hypothetical protein